MLCFFTRTCSRRRRSRALILGLMRRSWRMSTVGLSPCFQIRYLVVPKLTFPYSGSPGESARCVTTGEHPTETFPAADRSKELQCKKVEAKLRVSIHLTIPRSIKAQQERRSSSLIHAGLLSPTSTTHKRTNSSRTARPTEQTGTSSVRLGSSAQFQTPQ
jgi:hypothetical protein